MNKEAPIAGSGKKKIPGKEVHRGGNQKKEKEIKRGEMSTDRMRATIEGQVPWTASDTKELITSWDEIPEGNTIMGTESLPKDCRVKTKKICIPFN